MILLKQLYSWAFLWRLNAIVCAFHLIVLVGSNEYISRKLAMLLLVSAVSSAIFAAFGYFQNKRELE